MSSVKQNAGPPAGSLPPGLLNKVMVALGTVLVLVLILSTAFGGGRDEEASDDGEPPPAVGAAVSRPVDLDAVIEQQQRRAEAQRRAQLQEEQRRLAEFALQQPQDVLQNPVVEAALLQPDSLGHLPDPDAVELRRQLDLEDLEREITSIRAGPVAQSFRDRNNSATGEEGDTPVPAPATADPTALLRALAPSGIAGNAPPPAGELDIPLPTSTNLPEYAEPPRLTDPDDPPGWERIYEGSFLEAVLVTQLTGEFPGPALAMVNVPFYSADRQRVLIPRGSRLIGTAQAVRRRDQARLAVGFHRLVLEDGRHVPLRFLGLTQPGESGLADQVDRHYMSTFLAAGAIGLLSGLALYQGDPYGGRGAGLLGRAGAGIGGSGQQMLDPFLNRLPTVTIRAGHRLRIWFTSDLLIPRPPA